MRFLKQTDRGWDITNEAGMLGTLTVLGLAAVGPLGLLPLGVILTGKVAKVIVKGTQRTVEAGVRTVRGGSRGELLRRQRQLRRELDERCALLTHLPIDEEERTFLRSRLERDFLAKIEELLR